MFPGKRKILKQKIKKIIPATSGKCGNIIYLYGNKSFKFFTSEKVK